MYSSTLGNYEVSENIARIRLPTLVWSDGEGAGI